MKTKFSLLLASMLVLSACAEPGISTTTPSAGGDSSANSSTATGTTEIVDNSSSTSTEQVKTPDSSTTESHKDKFALTFDENENIAAYKAEAKSSVEFIKKNVTYKVGDYNAFDLAPKASLLNVSTFATTEYTEGFDIKLERLVEGEYVELDADALKIYTDSIDAKNAKIDFADDAIGQTFKITYIPSAIPAAQQTSITARDLVVEVRKGYNVTNVNELAYITNDTQDIPSMKVSAENVKNAKTEWDAFKTAHGLDVNYVPEGLFLHCNLTIGLENFPKAYLINDYETTSEAYIGKLNDEVEIYQRNLKDGEKFEIRGNYFSIDASAIPVVGLESNSVDAERAYQISHSQLFFFQGEHEEETAVNENAPEVTLSDLRLYGNTPKSEDANASGGLIMAKPRAIKYTVDNTRTLKWFITYYGEKTRSPIVFDSCNASDNFNTFVYSWGCPDLTIKDSKMIGCGGPCIIADHVNITEKLEKQFISNINVVNSKLQSFVEGTEGWFTIMSANALVPQVRVFDETLRATFGTTFLFKDKKADAGNVDKTFFNLISINKDGGAQAPKPNPDIRGSIKFDESTFDYGEADPIFNQTYQGALALAPKVPPILRTNGVEDFILPIIPNPQGGDEPMLVPSKFVGTAIMNPTVDPTKEGFYASFAALHPMGGFNEQRLPNGETPAPYAIGDKTTAMNKGDKLAIYYMGMMFVFEYGLDADNAYFNK